MNATPDLSIVIVSYNVRALLEQCLDSLVPTEALELEIFVVDNASADGTPAMVTARFPSVRVMANQDNRGFSAANNQGLSQASGRYMMLLNPDTRVTPGALATLVRFMDTHPGAGACGPTLKYGDGSFQHPAFMFPSLTQIYFDLFPSNWRLRDSRLNGRYPRAFYLSGQPFQIDHPLGAAFLARRQTVDEVGPLDEDYFIYVEEVDWAWRMRKAGWEIWCVPEAEIIHYEAQSTRQAQSKMAVELWRARFAFFRKHYSPLFNAAAALLVSAGLRRAESKARDAYRSGKISAAEYEQRVGAGREVRALISRARRPQVNEKKTDYSTKNNRRCYP